MSLETRGTTVVPFRWALPVSEERGGENTRRAGLMNKMRKMMKMSKMSKMSKG